MTKLSSSLPNSDANGLDSLNTEMVRNPADQHIVIAVVDCKTITTDTDTGFEIATARILSIEPLSGREAEQAVQLKQDAMERRTGVKKIDGLAALMNNNVTVMSFNPTTGEVND